MNITRVRLNEQEGRNALQHFIFGGHYGPVRVPRGIEPDLVSAFIRDNVSPKTDSEDLHKALEVMRFYERSNELNIFAPGIRSRPAARDDFQRQAVICQMFGDLGQTQESQRASEHFNQSLVPHPDSIRLSALVLETLAVLAPAADLAPYESRIDAELARLAPDQRRSEETMGTYDKVAAVKRNALPATRRLIEGKTKLAAQKAPERAAALAGCYLGRGPVDHPYLRMWAGRMLRLDAFAGDPAPARAQFSKAIDSIRPDLVGKEPAADVLLVRAARALEYFEGKLNDEQRTKVASAKTKTMDFLDDSD